MVGVYLLLLFSPDVMGLWFFTLAKGKKKENRAQIRAGGPQGPYPLSPTPEFV